jgi:hypothetical protein
MEEYRRLRRFHLGYSRPTRLFGVIQRWKERQPVQVVLAEEIHHPGDLQA